MCCAKIVNMSVEPSKHFSSLSLIGAFNTERKVLSEILLNYAGIAPGGINFDARVRRESFEPIDLLHAHIGAMDAFARGLK